MKSKLEALLSREQAAEECDTHVLVSRNPIAQAYITKSALAKANAYARLARDVLEENVECYGYLISPKNVKDRIVRDVYLASHQEVSSAEVKIDGESVIEAGRTIDRMGYKVLGWWHSHAAYSTFHSTTDDENMMKVLNAIAPTNYITIHKQIPLLSGDLKVRKKGADLEVYVAQHPSENLKLHLGSDKFDVGDAEVVKRVTARLPVNIGFAYSIVVNARGDKPYCEIATRHSCDFCDQSEDKSVEARLRIVDRGELKVDEEELHREIKLKLQKRKKIAFSNIGGANGVEGRETSYNPSVTLSREQESFGEGAFEDDTEEE